MKLINAEVVGFDLIRFQVEWNGQIEDPEFEWFGGYDTDYNVVMRNEEGFRAFMESEYGPEEGES